MWPFFACTHRLRLSPTVTLLLRFVVVLIATGGILHASAATEFCWSSWDDRDDPSSTGDWELLSLATGEGFCSHPTAIQCVDIYTGIDARLVGDVMKCDPTVGLICKNAEQPGRRLCRDYKIRVKCPCSQQACKRSEKNCGNGRCVPLSKVCDGHNDCGEGGADEAHCPNSPISQCSSRQFLCRNRQKCISVERKCDRNADCDDQSDEISCSASNKDWEIAVGVGLPIGAIVTGLVIVWALERLQARRNLPSHPNPAQLQLTTLTTVSTALRDERELDKRDQLSVQVSSYVDPSDSDCLLK